MNTTKKTLLCLPLLLLSIVTTAQVHINGKNTSAAIPNVTNISGLTVFNPPTSISGGDALCSGSSTYSVNGLLSGSTVLWSVNSPSVVMFQPNGDDIVLTPIGSGIITLTATVYGPGSSTPIILTKSISVGTIVAADIIGMQPGTLLSAGQYVTLYVNESAINYHWYIGGATIISSTNEPSITVKLDNCFPGQQAYNYFDVTIHLENGCGIGARYFEHVNAVCGGGMDPEFRVAVSPNPTNGKTVTVTVENISSEMKLLKADASVSYQLYDFHTKQLVRQWQFKNNNKQPLDISGIKAGEYFVVVTKAGKLQSSKIIIR